MHCLDTISKLNRQEAQADNLSQREDLSRRIAKFHNSGVIEPRPSAIPRIKALRDHYNRSAGNAAWRPLEVCILRDFVNDLELLISRIELDEKEVS